MRKITILLFAFCLTSFGMYALKDDLMLTLRAIATRTRQTAISFSVAEELLCSAAPVGYYYIGGFTPKLSRPLRLSVFVPASLSQIPGSGGLLMQTG